MFGVIPWLIFCMNKNRFPFEDNHLEIYLCSCSYFLVFVPWGQPLKIPVHKNFALWIFLHDKVNAVQRCLVCSKHLSL